MIEMKPFSEKMMRALSSMSDEELDLLEEEADSMYLNKASSPFEIFVLGYELGQRVKDKRGHVFCGSVDDQKTKEVRTYFFVGTEYEIMARFTKIVLMNYESRACQNTYYIEECA